LVKICAISGNDAMEIIVLVSHAIGDGIDCFESGEKYF
jgi:hypothetical protein